MYQINSDFLNSFLGVRLNMAHLAEWVQPQLPHFRRCYFKVKVLLCNSVHESQFSMCYTHKAWNCYLTALFTSENTSAIIKLGIWLSRSSLNTGIPTSTIIAWTTANACSHNDDPHFIYSIPPYGAMYSSTGNCSLIWERVSKLYMTRYVYFLLLHQHCHDLFCALGHPSCHRLGYLSGPALRVLFFSLGSC